MAVLFSDLPSLAPELQEAPAACNRAKICLLGKDGMHLALLKHHGGFAENKES